MPVGCHKGTAQPAQASAVLLSCGCHPWLDGHAGGTVGGRAPSLSRLSRAALFFSRKCSTWCRASWRSSTWGRAAGGMRARFGEVQFWCMLHSSSCTAILDALHGRPAQAQHLQVAKKSGCPRD